MSEAICQLNGTANTIDPAKIKLREGQVVECEFTNTKLSTILMRKETHPDGSPEAFVLKGGSKADLADAMVKLGDKVQGRQLALEAKVNITPGSPDPIATEEEAVASLNDAGFEPEIRKRANAEVPATANAMPSATGASDFNWIAIFAFS